MILYAGKYSPVCVIFVLCKDSNTISELFI